MKGSLSFFGLNHKVLFEEDTLAKSDLNQYHFVILSELPDIKKKGGGEIEKEILLHKKKINLRFNNYSLGMDSQQGTLDVTVYKCFKQPFRKQTRLSRT